MRVTVTSIAAGFGRSASSPYRRFGPECSSCDPTANTKGDMRRPSSRWRAHLRFG